MKSEWLFELQLKSNEYKTEFSFLDDRNKKSNILINEINNK